MKNTPTISVVIAVLIITSIAGCGGNARLVSGEKIDSYELLYHCDAVGDASIDYDRAKKQVNNAELHLANIRATVMRGEKRSPLAKMMAAHGLQNDQLGAVAWAESMLGNEDIEEQARSQVWLVELRQAKAAHESLKDRAEDLDDLWSKTSRAMKAAGISKSDCRNAGYW